MSLTNEGTAYLQSVDSRMKPLSKRAPVVPRQVASSERGDHDRPMEDFDWLVSLCRAADQQQVIDWLRLLYGRAECPVCSQMLEVMAEIERSYACEK